MTTMPTMPTHKAGTLRSDYARAKLSLAMFRMMENVPDGKFSSTSGYWTSLHYYGRVCWDRYDQLRRYLTPAHADDLRQILVDSDNED